MSRGSVLAGLCLLVATPAAALELSLEGGPTRRLGADTRTSLGGGQLRLGLAGAPVRSDRVELALIGGSVGEADSTVRWGGLSVRFQRLLAPHAPATPFWGAGLDTGWVGQERSGGFFLGGHFAGGVRVRFLPWLEGALSLEVGLNGAGPGVTLGFATIVRLD